MDMSLIHAALMTLVFVAVYAILARGLLNASEHFRAKCLDLYAKILKSGRADPQLVQRLDEYMDELYSSRAAWKLVFLIICAVFIALPARKLRALFVGPSEIAYLDDIPEAIRKDFDRFTSYWILSAVANSPAAALIFGFTALIGLAFLVPTKMIARILTSHMLPFDHRTAH